MLLFCKHTIQTYLIFCNHCYLYSKSWEVVSPSMLFLCLSGDFVSSCTCDFWLWANILWNLWEFLEAWVERICGCFWQTFGYYQSWTTVTKFLTSLFVFGRWRKSEFRPQTYLRSHTWLKIHKGDFWILYQIPQRILLFLTLFFWEVCLCLF